MEIGDKVVCVNDKFHPVIAQHYTMLPRKGVTYVIRDVRLGIRLHPKTEGDISLLLVGVINPKSQARSALEFGFSSSRFRKLDEMRTAALQDEVKENELANV